MGEGTIEKNTLEEMTNEEYREELRKLFNEIDNNMLLRYFYILLPKLVKEWN